MCVLDLLCVCVCAFLIKIVNCAPDIPASWSRSQPPQTLHALMLSIDERLHTFENTKWETILKQVEQRLDSLENTIRRLDSAFQGNVDKLERNLNSKELKDELTVEKLSHKVRDILDSSYDRYHRRLGYTEERLEMSLKKVQMNIEGSLNRIEKQQEDIQTEVLEGVTILEDLKSHMSTNDDKLNSTHKAIQQHIENLMSPNNEELQRISGSLQHLGSRFNNSMGMWGSQNDGPQSTDFITIMRNEINIEANKFANKVNNMYNDVWRRLVSVESLTKELSRVSNTSQQEVLEEVRSLVLNDRRDILADSNENFMEVALDALERKLQRKLLDLGRKLDDRLDTLSATQNLVMDSCFDGGICRGLESRLSQVLEKIFDVFSKKTEGFSNRTFNMENLVIEIMELVKNQHSQLIRTITHNTNMVVTLAKDSSDANKLLHNSVTQLMEKSEELQDEFQEIVNLNGKICTENETNNEENINQQKPPALNTPKNITELKIIALNTTQRGNTNKHHDVGILKITTDDFGVLVDNSTVIKTVPSEFNTTQKTVDHTIMKIISMISPNLTDNQLETFIQVLNRSVSLEHLEAIIQNTEAETKDDIMPDGTSIEIYDTEFLNKTNIEEDLSNIIEQETKTMLLPEMYGEADNLSDYTNNEHEQTGTIKTLTNKNTMNLMIFNETQLKSEEMITDLKDHINIYALLMKIKYGNVNITALWKQIIKTCNNTKDQTSQNLLYVLQNLCYGKRNINDLTVDYLNNIMRKRLLLINQTIDDVNFYEKIENICNVMIESVQSKKDRSEETLLH